MGVGGGVDDPEPEPRPVVGPCVSGLEDRLPVRLGNPHPVVGHMEGVALEADLDGDVAAAPGGVAEGVVNSEWNRFLSATTAASAG